jgi:hypothetical protein
MSGGPVVTLIGRSGCHLCDIARSVVGQALARAPFELVEIDVDSDPELRAEYGDQVPVVLVDARMHSFYEVDQDSLLAAVAAARNVR